MAESEQTLWVPLRLSLTNAEFGLDKIWDEIGTSEETRRKERDAILESLLETVHKYVEKAHEQRDALEGGVKATLKDCFDICERTGISTVPLHAFANNVGKSLLLRQAEVEGILTSLKEEEESRMKVQRELYGRVISLCREMEMGMEKKPASLSNREMEILRARIEELENMQAKRLQTEKEIARDIKLLWKELGIVVGKEQSGAGWRQSDELDRRIASFAVRPSESEIARMEERREVLRQEKERRIIVLKEYAQQITVLWDKLGVSQEERKAFFDMASRGVSEEVMQACERELQNKQATWKLMMRSVVEEKQRELVEWLLRLQLVEGDQKAQYPAAHSTTYSDELVSELDADIERAKAVYSKIKPLLALVKKRESCLKARRELEHTEGDTSRLLTHDRGAFERLRREEKLRNIVKYLPEIEAELESKVKAWEVENGQPFVRGGEAFLLRLQKDREEEEQRKVEEKNRKALEKQMRLQAEMGYAPSSSKKTPSVKRSAVRTSHTPAHSLVHSSTSQTPAHAPAHPPTSVSISTPTSILRKSTPATKNARIDVENISQNE